MGFYVQDDMWEAVAELPRKTQDEVIGSLARLYFTGEQTPLKGVSKSLVVAFRDRVLLSGKRSECGKQKGKQKRKQSAEQNAKQSEEQNAEQGGAEGGSEAASKAGSKAAANPKSPIKEGEREKETSPNGEVKKSGAFAPPSLAEVERWADEEGWPIDAGRFIAFYASNGWRVGKNPMRDWRAAAEGWCRRDGLKRRGEGKRRAKAQAACPICGGRMFRNTQSGRWDCPNCCESFDKEEVS